MTKNYSGSHSIYAYGHMLFSAKQSITVLYYTAKQLNTVLYSNISKIRFKNTGNSKHGYQIFWVPYVYYLLTLITVVIFVQHLVIEAVIFVWLRVLM